MCDPAPVSGLRMDPGAQSPYPHRQTSSSQEQRQSSPYDGRAQRSSQPGHCGSQPHSQSQPQPGARARSSRPAPANSQPRPQVPQDPSILKRLSRADLLELMLEQAQQIEELQAELAQARAKLAKREIALEECGSIAEAALHLNGVFEAAQQAANQYLENVRRLNPMPRAQNPYANPRYPQGGVR